MNFKLSQLKPNGNRVLFKLEPVDEKKLKVLVLPGEHSEKTRIGTVVSIGPDVKYHKPGDTIAVNYYTGTLLHFYDLEDKIEGTDTLRMCNEGEILAKIEW